MNTPTTLFRKNINQKCIDNGVDIHIYYIFYKPKEKYLYVYYSEDFIVKVIKNEIHNIVCLPADPWINGNYAYLEYIPGY